MFKQKFDFPTIEIGFTQNPSLLPVWILVVVLYLRFRNIAHFKAFFVFERASAISLKVWWIAIFQISPKQSLALLQQKKINFTVSFNLTNAHRQCMRGYSFRFFASWWCTSATVKYHCLYSYRKKKCTTFIVVQILQFLD